MNKELGIPAKVWNGIQFGSYEEIAQEVPSNKPEHRRWIALYAIYKLDEDVIKNIDTYDFIKKSSGYKYCVIDFEIPINTLEISDGINLRDASSFRYTPIYNESELVSFFEKEGVNPALFVPSWRCEYPF
ncbi:hypothetical protein [Serratia fonticola]|uniref:hypothetical protein n=1 Tax=Serratia fonticola TaxID=47917 RepID=UPI0021B74EE6|nr:hypothetical protein [Serratia fonticola]